MTTLDISICNKIEQIPISKKSSVKPSKLFADMSIIETLKEENNQLKSEIITRNTYVDTLVSTIETLKEENNQLKSEIITIETLKEENNQLKSEIITLKSEIITRNTYLDILGRNL